VTLVVCHGLGVLDEYRDELEDVEARVRGLSSLVERGYATLLREVVWPTNRPEREVRSGSIEGGRVFEAASAGGRWVPEDEAQPMLKRVAQLYGRDGSYVSFPYDDASPGIDAVEVNFVNDGPTKLRYPFDLEIGPRLLRAWPLTACFMGTGDDPRVQIAWEFHRLAEELRLVLAVG
jgi:hypothetical protein